ncbi:MAG: putative DNA binding domain-containing protein [Burkholderiales bacterium]|nr:putative DNA binding domain-containing protein [Burkholderiales bacterium]
MLNKLNNLISNSLENELLEFKEAKNTYDLDKLGKYFSALSNEANLSNSSEAWLIFGVNDKRNIIGTQFRPKFADLQSLKAEVANHTTNRITFIDIHEVITESGRVIMFQIPPAPNGLPIAWKGHYYGRDGEELQPLNLEEIDRIRRKSTFIDWSSGICESATVNDLDSAAIEKARLQYKVKHPHLVEQINQWDDTTFLNKAKLLINNQITNTAILLLGKSESEHFISPALAKITWILKDKDNLELDYQHFSCPFLLNVEAVYSKIRNLKYRYIRDGSLFPEEIEQYDPYIIREALNNCIAHQDYTVTGRINVVENDGSSLVFSNAGSFIPGSVENVIEQDAPQEQYRNPFLANAMVNLNMIDTIGSGIKRIFTIQKRRFFPMPDYTIDNNRVMVTITGKVLDMAYAKLLATNPELSLVDILLLDKVQKKKPLTDEEITHLRTNGFIEGRKPNVYISSTIAHETAQQTDYMKQKGIDNEYCRKMIIDYLTKFKTGTRENFEKIILSKLPDVLNDTQKKNKIRNVLQSLKDKNIIEIDHGKSWRIKNV